MSKQPPTAPNASAVGPCPTLIQISRTPWHWKFTQHLRTTRPPPVYMHFCHLRKAHNDPMLTLDGTHIPVVEENKFLGIVFDRKLVYSSHQIATSWLVGCFGFNGPLRQYFSLYRAVSQREGERGERIDESKNVQITPTRTYCKRNILVGWFWV